MTVTHRINIVGKCPIDGATDIYELTVVTNKILKAEEVLDAIKAATARPGFQEAITAAIKSRLTDVQSVTTIGVHSGVETTVEC